MAKGSSQRNQQVAIDNQIGANNQWNQDFQANLAPQINQWNEQASQLFGDTYNNIQSMWNQDIRDPGFGRFTNEYGGLDPKLANVLKSDANALRNFASYGGVDTEGRNRIRGDGYFDELRNTGGYSDEDKANIRSRTARQTPAFYDSLRNNLQQQNAAQGGYNPGYGSQQAKLTRDSARATQDSVLGGEINLADSIRSGKLSGATGMSQAEQSLQSLISQNTLGGYSGAANISGNLAGMIQKGQMFGTSGLLDIQLANQARKMGLIDDMGNLTALGLDQANQLTNFQLQSQMGTSNTNAGLLGIRGQNRDRGWWENWGRDVFGGSAAVAGAAATG